MERTLGSKSTTFQEVPVDILLLILDYIPYSSFIVLRSLSRLLKDVIDAYLKYHPSITLDDRHSEQGYGIAQFLTDISHCKAIALSIRTVNVCIIHPSWVKTLSQNTRKQILQVIRYRSANNESDKVEQLLYSDNIKDFSSWVLIALLMCRNVEHVKIIAGASLQWLHIAQRLDFKQWPNKHVLQHIDIRWPVEGNRRYSPHDLQDIWLLFTAPGLRSIRITGLEQGNNLYTGNADRAFLRTTYWPVELELPSLYHHMYNHQCVPLRYSHHGRPDSLPAPPTKLPITHGFKSLEKLVLHTRALEATWLPSILPCFTRLQHLDLELRMTVGTNASSGLIDIRLLSIALDKVAPSLKYLRLNFTIAQCPSFQDYLKALGQGYMGLSVLGKLEDLESAVLPWYVLLTDVLKMPLSSTPVHARLTAIPSKLKELTISQCELIDSKTLVALLEALIVVETTAGTRSALEKAILQAEMHERSTSIYEVLEKELLALADNALERGIQLVY